LDELNYPKIITMNPRKSFLILFFTTTLLLIISCENQKDPAEYVITGSLVNSSECKSFKSGDLYTDGWDTIYCIQYSYDGSSKILSLKHINAIFNCCPDSLFCEVSYNNNTIIIRENEKENLCSCVCQYDLNIELTGVVRDQYLVIFIIPRPYVYAESPLIFNMNLQLNNEGEYCW
jgi:hypothetical protein